MLVLKFEISNWNVFILIDNASIATVESLEIGITASLAFICDNHSIRNGSIKHEGVLLASKSQVHSWV